MMNDLPGCILATTVSSSDRENAHAVDTSASTAIQPLSMGIADMSSTGPGFGLPACMIIMAKS